MAQAIRTDRHRGNDRHAATAQRIATLPGERTMPHHRRSPTCLMSVPGFEMALGCTIDLWSGVRTGVTLFAVSWLLPAPSEVESTAAAALSPLGSVGRLPDRRIGLAYVEPRGSRDDLHPDTVHRIVQNRLERCLTDAGWHRFAWATRIASARGWSDDMDGPADLINRLPIAEQPLTLARL